MLAARILQKRLPSKPSFGGNPARSEALAFDKEREAHQGCQMILTWLADKEFINTDHREVLREARLRIALAEACKVPSRADFHLDNPFDDVIDICWPAESMNKEVGIISWFAEWLAQLTFYWFEDSPVCARAIDLAIAQGIVRQSCAPLNPRDFDGFPEMVQQQSSEFVVRKRRKAMKT